MPKPPSRMPEYTNDYFQAYRDKGVNATAGRYTYGRPEIQFRPANVSTASVSIGNFCSIARHCVFNIGDFGRHTIDYVSSYPLSMVFGNPKRRDASAHERPGASIKIGSDVWIGEGCFLAAGVEVGHGAVIGARSLVLKSVPPYAIVGGSPAKFIRDRFAAEIIADLLAIAWWEWPDEKIKSSLDLFFSTDIKSSVSAMRELC